MDGGDWRRQSGGVLLIVQQEINCVNNLIISSSSPYHRFLSVVGERPRHSWLVTVSDRAPASLSAPSPSTPSKQRSYNQGMASSASRTVMAVALLLLAAAQPARANPACFTRVFSFGDSLADTGNYGFVFPNDTWEPSQRLPYGETYFHNATGRFSNGRIIVDFIGTTVQPLAMNSLAGVLILKSLWVGQRTSWGCRLCRRTGAGGARGTLRAGPTSRLAAPRR